ncbi:MAG: hypothetical protein U1E05_20045 [Patescibacteria group bacterium]|nr:hypothetical protein [Patescibacteria group bacterium]
MREILFEFQLSPTTWAYVSALMTIGVYFKFHRFWSVRNLDLIGLIAFSPGLLLIFHGLVKGEPLLMQGGYVWLFVIGGFFLIRLLLDPVMVRRPLLEPNLSASGLTFTGASLLVFLMANVVMNPDERMEYQLAKQPVMSEATPGYPPLLHLATISEKTVSAVDKTHTDEYRRALLTLTLSRSLVVLSHLSLVLGIVLVGYRHFDNIHTGVAAASLYLLLFYSSQMTGRLDHVIPAAVLVWAVVMYRRPIVSGLLVGMAASLVFYPLFLLPLWCGFYWSRGLIRFSVAVAVALLVMIILLIPLAGVADFPSALRHMFGLVGFATRDASGFWTKHAPVFRIPVAAAFIALSASLALWPAQKNLGTLLSCSAAVMLGSQFWHMPQGGLCMAWYLPLLILTVFRPNLEDRVAQSAVVALRFRRGRMGVPSPSRFQQRTEGNEGTG